MEIYVTLNMLGIKDPDISLSNMGQIPIRVLISLCLKGEEMYKMFQNKASQSAANTAFLVYNFGVSMSGGKAQRKVTAANFLPYPEVAQSNGTKEISQQAKQEILKLLKSKILTHKQITILSSLTS